MQFPTMAALRPRGAGGVSDFTINNSWLCYELFIFSFLREVKMRGLLLAAAKTFKESQDNALTHDPMWASVTFLLNTEDSALGLLNTSTNRVTDKRNDNVINHLFGSAAPSIVQDPVRGKVLSFPANNNSRLVLPNTNNVLGINPGNGNFTLDYWVKGNQPTADGQSIIASADAPFSYMDFVEASANGVGYARFYVDLENGWQSLWSTKVIYNTAGDVWHHIAKVYDRSNNQIRLYVDGVNSAVLNNYLSSKVIEVPGLTLGRYNDFAKNRSIHKVRLTNAVRFSTDFDPATIVY